MLKIGVQLPGTVENAGDFLADARALDAAGIDSFWLNKGGHEPWLLLAAIASVTGRVRLVAPVSATDVRLPTLIDVRVATLDCLSRGRMVLQVEEPVPPAGESADTFIAWIRGSPQHPVMLQWNGNAVAASLSRLAAGIIVSQGSPETCRAACDAMLQLREAQDRSKPLEVWARVKTPDSREDWNLTLGQYETAGATGVLVPAGPRLLDLIRNTGENEDRSDLSLAQG